MGTDTGRPPAGGGGRSTKAPGLAAPAGRGAVGAGRTVVAPRRGAGCGGRLTATEAARLAERIGNEAPWCRARVSAGRGGRHTVRVTDLRDGRLLFVAAEPEWAAAGIRCDHGAV